VVSFLNRSPYPVTVILKATYPVTVSLKARVKDAALPSGPAVRTLPVGIGRGLRMEIDFASETLLYLGLYEVELNRHIRRLCPPGGQVFDVGGQHGYDALVFAKLTGQDGRVVSFDCDVSAIAEMRRSCTANPHLAHRITVVDGFVGRGPDAISLDHAAETYFYPTFIKLDIEGGEAEALRGATEVLRRRPGMLIEVHGVEAEEHCLDIVRTNGYAVEIVNPRRWLKEHRPIEHNRWLICEPHGDRSSLPGD
jgi:Methyltransferase FkbM domain